MTTYIKKQLRKFKFNKQQQNIIIHLLLTNSFFNYSTNLRYPFLPYIKKRMPLSVTFMNHFYQQNVFAAIHLSVE